eukprot:1261842-Amphidinium_carterae.1
MLLHRLQAECRPIHHAHHGFAPGLSCETAVAAMTHHIQQQMTSGTHTRVGILKLDLKSAFDQVVPTFLMQQLTSAGASFPLRQLLWTWLRRRRFTVRVDGSVSRSRCARRGVPQGGSLAPWLYTVYVNDIIAELDNLPDTRCICYADDITVITTAKSVTQIEKQLELAFRVASKLEDDLGIPVNAVKSSTTLFTPIVKEVKTELIVSDLRPHAHTQILIGADWEDFQNHLCNSGRHMLLLDWLSLPYDRGKIISANGQTHFTRETLVDMHREGNISLVVSPVLACESDFHLLGISITNTLSITPYARKLRASIIAKLAVLKRLAGCKWGPSIRLLRRVCRAYVFSSMQYCAAPLFFLASQDTRLRMEINSSHACRVVAGLPSRSSTTIAHFEAGLPTLQALAEEQAVRLHCTAQAQPEASLLHQALLHPCAHFAKAGEGWVAAVRSLSLDLSGVSRRQIPLDAFPCQHFLHNLEDRRSHSHSHRRAQADLHLAHLLDEPTCFVVTDASLQAGRAGLGARIAIGDRVDRVSAPALASSSGESELMAFCLALQFLHDHALQAAHLIWATDSRTAMALLLRKQRHGPELIQAVRQGLSHACVQTLHILKVPSHVGWAMHDAIDELADQAARNNDLTGTATQSWLSYRTHLRQVLWQRWLDQVQLRASTDSAFQSTSRYLANMIDKKGKHSWRMHALHASRHRQRTLSMLRAHNHPYFYDKICTCGQPLSWLHALQCPAVKHRLQLFQRQHGSSQPGNNLAQHTKFQQVQVPGQPSIDLAQHTQLQQVQ